MTFRKSVILSLGMLAGLVALGAQPAPVTVIEGATVIDAVSVNPIRDAAIEIQNGVIRHIGRRGSFAIAAHAQRVNLTGRTIVPGLINVHTHLAGGRPAADDSVMPPGGVIERNADRYLFYGVTHVMSLGTDGEAMDAYRRDEDARRGSGAFVFFAGYGSSAKEGWQGQNKNLHRPTTPEEAREAVRAEVVRHVDAIKFWVDSDHGKLPKLPPDVYGAIINEAHRDRLKAFCHMFELEDSKELVRRGLDVLAHSIRDREVDDEFLKLAREHGVVAVPALVGHASVYTYAERPAFLDDPGLPRLYARSLLTELGSAANQQKVAADPRVPVVRQEVAIALNWIESAANYVQLYSRGRSFMLRMTMGELEEKLNAPQFARIHRSTIVNVDRLVEVKPSLHGDFDVVLQDGTILRMSRGYRDRVLPR
jgi:hypothetical protein